MEILIAGMIFAAVAVIVWTVIQARTQAHLATQMRLDRVAGNLSPMAACQVDVSCAVAA